MGAESVFKEFPRDLLLVSDSLAWFIYWMQNLPGANNRLTYRGRPLANWWAFIGDFDSVMADWLGLVE